MLLGSLLCKWKGHRWSRAKRFMHADGYGVAFGRERRIKTCLRCGLEREVKTRTQVPK